MPDYLSMFTPCGMMELTSEPSHGERIYNSICAALGGDGVSGGFDMTPGTLESPNRMEAWAYAMAMMLAQVAYTLDRAGNQAHPLTAYDLLPLLEQAYLVVPSPRASVSSRAATLAAIDALSAGGRLSDVASGLRSLLGATLLAVVPMSALLAQNSLTPTVYPATPATGGGNWVNPQFEGEFLQLVDPVASTGTQWVAYQSLDTLQVVTQTWLAGSTYATNARIVPLTSPTGYFYQCTTAGIAGTTEPTWPTLIGATVTDGGAVWTCSAPTSPLLYVGQSITVQGENTASIERVTVLAVSPTPQGLASSGPCFQAAFTKAHDIGATVVTGPFPYWWSTSRTLVVVLTAAGAADRETRRKVDGFLRKAAKGVDQWSICGALSTTETGGTIGPLTVGLPMGTQPLASSGPLTFTSTT